MSERLSDEPTVEAALELWKHIAGENARLATTWSARADQHAEECDALRARVAKLERALEEIAERRFLAETMIEIARAALKDAPQ